MLPIERLRDLEVRYEALIESMADPAVATDPGRLREVGQEQADLEPLVVTFRAYDEVLRALAATTEMRSGEADSALVEMIDAEVTALEQQQLQLERRLRDLLVPADPLDKKNVIVEIRAGTGGDEAGLFGADLYRMYQRYADERGWNVEVISTSESGVGGLKEITFEVKGTGAYSRLKWESGVHRVQRVPATEASGRIHTSTATVAVLPEMDEVEISIPDGDLRIDVFRATGPGGQSVNTTDSAVRITHLPTGLVVSCQDQKSQFQNRRKGMAVLRARLHQLEEDRQHAERSATRRSQIGSADRAEKIRTYNFPQSRVTDHRIGLTLHRLDAVMAGDLDEFIDSLGAADRERALETADV
jgi:peptide chain release factor 1